MLFRTTGTVAGWVGAERNISASSWNGCYTGFLMQDIKKRRMNRQDAKGQASDWQKCSTWLSCWSILTITGEIFSQKTLMESARASFRPRTQWQNLSRR